MLFSDPDITFFHAPSIFDFRERPEVLGPISDVIPSSPVFEMYPIELTSLADRLEREGYNARIINLAHEMLTDPEFDPEAEIAACSAKWYAVDLHWLPHAHGAIEVARLIKKHHPDAPVIFGGLSSTYYHEELIEYPSVDYVLRGDRGHDRSCTRELRRRSDRPLYGPAGSVPRPGEPGLREPRGLWVRTTCRFPRRASTAPARTELETHAELRDRTPHAGRQWQNDGLASFPRLAKLGLELTTEEAKQRLRRAKWAIEG